jgi:hypothetical protein
MLFQIAAVIGIARKSNQSYGFAPLINSDHKERFGSAEPVNIEDYFVHPFPRLNKPVQQFANRNYAWGFHDIYLPAGDWDISGHFQCDRYFDKDIDEVRALMTMKDEVDYSDHVAIHVRRGDYDDRYHPRIGIEYYAPAVANFPKDSRFLLFSDEPQLALEMFKDGFHEITVVSGNTYLEDFKIMKRCGGFITANSSFSLMAAILSAAPGKKIVCPRRWFGPAWNPETHSLYPKGSIQI